MGKIRVRRVTLSGEQRCPLCREDLDAPPDELAVCAGCDAVHHLDCVDEFGGGACATCGRPLREALVPRAQEGSGDAWTLVLFEPQGFLGDQLLLWATGLVVFGGVMAGVVGVMALRWPPWTLAAACLLPLVGYGLLALARELRERPRRPRLRRPPAGK
jgi:hypothetical protein